MSWHWFAVMGVVGLLAGLVWWALSDGSSNGSGDGGE